MEFYGVIFDWDGVVIDSSRQHELSWERLAMEEGRELPEHHFKQGFGKVNRWIIPHLLQWTDRKEEIARLSARKEALYRDILLEEPIALLPGVKMLLELLREMKIPAVVGSSTERENILAVWGRLGISHYFQGCITSEDVQQGKPNPEVFLKAANVIDTLPCNAIVIEDSHAGIEAGLAGGMTVLAVATTHPQDTLVQAHQSINSLADWDREDWIDFLRLKHDNCCL